MTQAATHPVKHQLIDPRRMERSLLIVEEVKEEVRSLSAGRDAAADAEVGSGVLPAWWSAGCPRRGRTFLRRGLAVPFRLSLHRSLPGTSDLPHKNTRVKLIWWP